MQANTTRIGTAPDVKKTSMGNAFAILQIKTIIAVLLNRYDFELLGDPIETDFQGLVLGPKPPIRIRYRRRRVDDARLPA